jgi:hypothetical protein
MTVSIGVGTEAYSDMVPIIRNLRNKGTVYYFNDAPTRWSIWFVTDNGSHLVYMPGASGTFPTSFSSDFPDAVLLTHEPIFAIGPVS